MKEQPSTPHQEDTAPWVEKYRPKSINQVSSQAEVISVLERSLASANLPHLLFYGPPGTGKTSTILALARDLFGPTLYRTRILELNASDDRGIATIRGRVKEFARTSVRETAPGYPCPPFKLILLDEADSLTIDAQTALRRIMETYSKGTRFCLVCNYVSRIIGPVASRCAKFRFKPVDQLDAKLKLMDIAKQEQIFSHPEHALDTSIALILEICKGDLRRSITLLQSVHQLAGSSGISPQLINHVSGAIEPTVIQAIYSLLTNPASAAPATKSSSSSITATRALLLESVDRNVIRRGYSILQLLQNLQLLLLNDPLISNIVKSQCALLMAASDYALHEGADEQLQLQSLFLSIQRYFISDTKFITVA